MQISLSIGTADLANAAINVNCQDISELTMIVSRLAKEAAFKPSVELSARLAFLVCHLDVIQPFHIILLLMNTSIA